VGQNNPIEFSVPQSWTNLFTRRRLLPLSNYGKTLCERRGAPGLSGERGTARTGRPLLPSRLADNLVDCGIMVANQEEEGSHGFTGSEVFST